jgi:hypothetical protein
MEIDAAGNASLPPLRVVARVCMQVTTVLGASLLAFLMRAAL